jgi:hypothetical protein
MKITLKKGKRFLIGNLEKHSIISFENYKFQQAEILIELLSIENIIFGNWMLQDQAELTYSYVRKIMFLNNRIKAARLTLINSETSENIHLDFRWRKSVQ